MGGVVRVDGYAAETSAQSVANVLQTSTSMNHSQSPESRRLDAYDPRSMNAMFATVLTRMDHQDDEMRKQGEALERIERAQNERMTALEDEVKVISVWKTEINTKIVMIGFLVSSVGTIITTIAVAFITK